MSKVAHLVRNGLFNGGISYGSSEKDAKYVTRENWKINGTTKLLTLIPIVCIVCSETKILRTNSRQDSIIHSEL